MAAGLGASTAEVSELRTVVTWAPPSVAGLVVGLAGGSVEAKVEALAGPWAEVSGPPWAEALGEPSVAGLVVDLAGVWVRGLAGASAVPLAAALG